MSHPWKYHVRAQIIIFSLLSVMDGNSGMYSLPAAPKLNNDTKKDHFPHPLIVACIRPKKNFTVECQDCKITFKQKKLLLHHRISVHGEKPEWQCKVCNMILSTKYILEAHMDTHKNAKKHKCPICTASFNTSSSCKRHFLYKHTKERPHQCSMCDFATIEHDKLLIHLRNHTGESPYICKTCGMTFKTPIAYKRHMVTHTGIRQYMCTLCLKKFGTPVTVKQHMRTAHDVDTSMLTPVRNVREHGVPSMLGTFLVDVHLGDEESKMVNSLKYYEVRKDALDQVDTIKNVDLSAFNNCDIVDKTAFFDITSLSPIVSKSSKDETDFSDPDYSETKSKNYKRKTNRPYTKKKQTKSDSKKPAYTVTSENTGTVNEDKEDIKDVLNMVNETEKVRVENIENDLGEPETKKPRSAITGSEPAIQLHYDEVLSTPNVTEPSQEVVDISRKDNVNETNDGTILHFENQQKHNDVEQKCFSDENVELGYSSQSNVAETELCEARRNVTVEHIESEKTQKAIGDVQNERIFAPVAMAKSACEFEDTTESSQDTPIFVNLKRKRFHIKTPRLQAKGTDTNKGGNKSQTKQTSEEAEAVKQILPNESNQNDITSFTQNTTKTVSKEHNTDKHDIPYPTHFVSVITEESNLQENSDEQAVPKTLPQMGNNEYPATEDSEAYGERTLEKQISLDPNAQSNDRGAKGGKKKLPYFIGLKGLTNDHQERLLIGMKKGVFGTSPSVVRVLDDGSMINITSLYRKYLPPDCH